MTDRGESALRTTRETFRVGPSALRWREGRLEFDIDEVSSLPLVSRVRGRIIVTPSAITDVEMPLTGDGAHVWRPFAPISRIQVDLGPGWRWSGHGYFDANFGTRALEADFDYWTWGRYPTGEGATCFYDAPRRDGSVLGAGVRFGTDGSAEEITPPPVAGMRRSAWMVRRETRSDAGTSPEQVLAMLDAPFYCRSGVRTTIEGEVTVGVHEALDLARFRSPWLMPMLALRVPRRARWRFPEEA